jgi:large subunit ribosomal protein L5
MSTDKYTPRLVAKYRTEVVPALMKKFSYSSLMQAPRLEKICINRGVNGAVTDKKLVDVAVENCLRLQARKLLLPCLKKTSLTLSFVRTCPLGPELPCGE